MWLWTDLFLHVEPVVKHFTLLTRSTSREYLLFRQRVVSEDVTYIHTYTVSSVSVLMYGDVTVDTTDKNLICVQFGTDSCTIRG